jgi:hypothetical protein
MAIQHSRPNLEKRKAARLGYLLPTRRPLRLSHHQHFGTPTISDHTLSHYGKKKTNAQRSFLQLLFKPIYKISFENLKCWVGDKRKGCYAVEDEGYTVHMRLTKETLLKKTAYSVPTASITRENFLLRWKSDLGLTMCVLGWSPSHDGKINFFFLPLCFCQDTFFSLFLTLWEVLVTRDFGIEHHHLQSITSVLKLFSQISPSSLLEPNLSMRNFTSTGLWL